ncbi:hypothetical protein BaRGS_00009438, partial [Batillaria attramentaria]
SSTRAAKLENDGHCGQLGNVRRQLPCSQAGNKAAEQSDGFKGLDGVSTPLT